MGNTLKYKETLCASCEYLRNCVFPCIDYRTYDKPKFLGYGNCSNNKPSENPSRHCNHEKRQNVLVYEKLAEKWPCMYYEKRHWERPKTCGECDMKVVRYDNGRFTCSNGRCGTHCNEDMACIDGKSYIGAQISIFDL